MWRDTVMSRVVVNRVFTATTGAYIPAWADYGENHPTYKLLKAQAEISFKAGIREVVEWIRERAYKQFVTDEDLHLNYKDYQELKEWGIDED